ncbi:MAG: hypothetical protein NTZ52_07655 [Chlamydiae bacterium]|nr:hypothetical protein [Chlamydiota bacterium]
MNILLLISSMLIILSFISATTSHTSPILEAEKTSFTGYMQGVARTRNMWQHKLFIDATRSTQTSRKAGTIKRQSRKQFSSHRTAQNLSLHSKFNIAPFLSAGAESPQIAFMLQSLLEQLYGHTAFIKEAGIDNVFYEIVNLMQINGKKQSSVSELQDLSFEQEPLKTLFYKMLKGSGYYDLATQQGHPPLSDFLSIEKEENHSICFYFASYPVLKAVFGQSLADEIIDKENRKSQIDGARRVLSKEELSELLLASNNNKLQQIQELLSFSKSRGSLQAVSYKDRQSKVYTKLKVFE